MPRLPARARRSLLGARARWRRGQARSGAVAARLARASRLGGVAAGLLPREVAVLECRRGSDASGFFSEFAAVVGMLEHYERWRHLYAGIRLDFRHGLYLDTAVGPDWWQYYFEPLDSGDPSAPTRIVSPYYHDLCANRVERGMPRATAAALIDRHVVVRPRIQSLVAGYVREHWPAHFAVGVHYRGTDKAEDAPRVPYEQVEAVVRDTVKRSGSGPYRVFLATDEQAFVDYMRARFPDELRYREMFRSIDGRPTDVFNSDSNHKKGEDALVDCLLLSQTHHLVRTASNLSLCSTLFNPRLPETQLNRER